MSWSSGKDSAWALSKLLRDPQYKVTALFTTITEEFKRVSMHSVREELLDLQALMLDLPLYKVKIPYPCPNEIYEKKIKTLMEIAEKKSVNCVAFGDLFLEDIRSYRIDKMKETSIEPIFPIWGRNTRELALEMLESGLKATLTCIDEKKLPLKFAGADFNKDFLESLPENIDPCGENGEFHTFVHDCKDFKKPIPVIKGEICSREGFSFTDLKPLIS